jgi:D-3-phosphoglycerate dehydrogenase
MSLQVAITDHVFEDLNTEREILAEIDAEVVSLDTTDPDEVVERVPEVDALIVNKFEITDEVLDRLPNVAVVARYGSGYDNVDLDAATAHGVVVANVPNFCVDEAATHALTLALTCHRRVVQYDRAVRAGEWDWTARADQIRFQRQTVGIVGFGSIGRRMAELVDGVGADLVVYSRSTGQAELSKYDAEKVTFDELLERSDVVSIHTALSEDTYHLFDAASFEAMKESAILVNTARGDIVDQDALHDALEGNEIALAGLDVLAEEPPAPDEPLLGHDDVVVTPHFSWFSQSALDDLQRGVAEEVVRVLDGGRPKNVVNPSVYE